MLDIGFWELLIIMIVLLLVVGPERLPELARKAGRFIAQGKRMVESVRSDLEREFNTEELRRALDEQQREIRQLRSAVGEMAHEIERDANALSDEVRALSSPEAGNTARDTTSARGTGTVATDQGTDRAVGARRADSADGASGEAISAQAASAQGASVKPAPRGHADADPGPAAEPVERPRRTTDQPVDDAVTGDDEQAQRTGQ